MPRAAAITRCSSGWLRAWARPTGCSRRARPSSRLAETTAQAAGLEIVPRREVVYRDTVLAEMDLEGILRRAPELCLIDELAHTNAPGVEHAKRYEDVEAVLDAGIDVFSTVN